MIYLTHYDNKQWSTSICFTIPFVLSYEWLCNLYLCPYTWCFFSREAPKPANTLKPPQRPGKLLFDVYIIVFELIDADEQLVCLYIFLHLPWSRNCCIVLAEIVNDEFGQRQNKPRR